MKTESPFQLKNAIKVQGHRGSRGTHPENTIPSFEEATLAGADVLEFDLQLSKDDVPIISHDPAITGKLCRDASGMIVRNPIPIRKMTVKEIKLYDCGAIHQPKFPEQKRIPGTRIPTLEEVLEWASREAPTLWLNIETKMTADSSDLVPDPELFAKKVIEILRKYKVIERTNLQSFDFRTLQAAKKIEPGLKLACLFENQTNFVDLTLEQRCHIASPYFKLLNEERIKSAHEKKIEVIPWTVNEESDWKEVAKLGVDAIITDYPRKLIQTMRGWTATK